MVSHIHPEKNFMDWKKVFSRLLTKTKNIILFLFLKGFIFLHFIIVFVILFHKFSASFFSGSDIHQSRYINGCHAKGMNFVSISFLYVLRSLYQLHQVLTLSRSVLSRIVRLRSLSILGMTSQSETYLNADRKLLSKTFSHTLPTLHLSGQRFRTTF